MTVGTAHFDHFAIATWSIRDAANLFVDVMGGEFLWGGDDERLGIRTIQIKLPPEIKVELMEPLGEDSYLHRYLTKHGPGFHHVTLMFDDIEEVIPALEHEGFEVVDTDLSDRGWRDTYLRPSSAFGTLIQLVDSEYEWLTRDESVTIEDVLEGKLVWKESQPVWREPR